MVSNYYFCNSFLFFKEINTGILFVDVAKPIRTTPIRHTDPPFPRNSEVNRNPPKENDVAQITEGFRHMTFHNKNLRHRGE